MEDGVRLAVIDHIGNPGGGSRVARALLPALKKVRPEIEITFFGNPHSIRREKIDQIAVESNIRIHELSSAKLSGKDILNIRGSRHVIQLFQRKLSRVLTPLSFYLSGAVEKELEKVVKNYDLAFFIWPFHLKCPALKCPMAGIFHDFNFKYFFSGQTMAPWVLDFINREMPIWLSKATPIVSTEFMRGELKKFYPSSGDLTHVVPVAPTVGVGSSESCFQIEKKYILCPTNISSHKNTGTLISAFSILKRKGHDLLLIFTGSGTEIMNGRACEIGLEIGSGPADVQGLGYVTNEEMDWLIQHAEVVVNPSLYEGGNIPGFDAWEKGVPVAMSNIPPFLEHMQVHKVHAEIFDPRSPQDIAEKLDRLLSNAPEAKSKALASQQNIRHFTWEKTAEEYLKIFDGVLKL